MKNNKKTGIWIPIELMNNRQLDWVNKVLLSEIYSLAKLKNGCIASNQYFGELLQITKSSASKRITQLEEWGYITCKNQFKNKQCVGRIITKGSSPRNNTVVPTELGGSSNETIGVVPTEPYPSSQWKPINTNTNTVIKKQLTIHNTGATENIATDILSFNLKMRHDYESSYQLLLNATELGSDIFYYIKKNLVAILKEQIGEDKYAEIEPAIRMYNLSRGNL